MFKGRVCAGVAVAAAAVMTLGACGGAGGSDAPGGGGGDGASSLEVFSWWTSGSEAAALDVLGQAFTKADPDTSFDNAAVSGGGGSNARTVLATRLQGGDPPDSWQLHPDQDLFSVVGDGSVADISDLYEENGWESKIPPAVLDMLKVDGAYYAVPVNAHRANVLWTNPAALQKAGVSWDDSTTAEQFVADLATIKASGTTPVCLGGKDAFASAQLLEAIILANVGADGWGKLMDGSLSFDDASVRTAVQQFATVLDNTNSDASVLTWDQAAVDTADGKCAATLMGDWAFGELTNKGKADGTDFSHVTFPGTADVFDFVGDAFVIPAENGPNPEAEKVWLTQLLDPAVQSEFNLKKGSAPIVDDADLSGFPAYQQQAAADFQSKTIVSSLTHAQAAPGEFTSTYSDAVTSFLGSKNVDAFVKTMADAQKTQLEG